MKEFIQVFGVFVLLVLGLGFLLDMNFKHKKERIANTEVKNRKVELWYLGGFKDTINVKFPKNGTYYFRTSKGSSTLVFSTKEGYEYSEIKNVVNIKFLDQ